MKRLAIFAILAIVLLSSQITDAAMRYEVRNTCTQYREYINLFIYASDNTMLEGYNQRAGYNMLNIHYADGVPAKIQLRVDYPHNVPYTELVYPAWASIFTPNALTIFIVPSGNSCSILYDFSL